MVHRPDLLEVRYSPGKGRGIFARQRLPKGTRVLVEKPYLEQEYTRDAMGNFHSKTRWDDLQSTVNESSQVQKDEFDELCGYEGEWIKDTKEQDYDQPYNELPEAQRDFATKFGTNMFETSQARVLLPFASRFNHSCVPNTCCCWRHDLDARNIVTFRLRKISTKGRK